jgi:hypothetical protein
MAQKVALSAPRLRPNYFEKRRNFSFYSLRVEAFVAGYPLERVYCSLNPGHILFLNGMTKITRLNIG